MEDITEKLLTELRHNSQTYRYYLVGLTVTAIGFAVYNTMGVSLKWIQIPLGISILSWAISVFCGLQVLKNNLDVTVSQVRYLNYPAELETSFREEVKKDFMDVIDIGRKYSDVQEYLFYTGIISFIVWHILEMYNTTT